VSLKKEAEDQLARDQKTNWGRGVFWQCPAMGLGEVRASRHTKTGGKKDVQEELLGLLPSAQGGRRGSHCKAGEESRLHRGCREGAILGSISEAAGIIRERSREDPLLRVWIFEKKVM